MSGSESADRRARRLVRCYPPGWRARYGEEFVQLLIDDMAERPRSLSRTVDVVRSGIVARLGSVGLTDGVLDPCRRLRAGLGVLGVAVSVFLVAGVALWAQLTIGWQWSAPSASATRAGMVALSVTMLAFVLLALLAIVPLVWVLGRELVGGRGGKLVLPLVVSGVGAGVLIVGSVHFGHGWPGTGGHRWAGRELVPGGIARFCWAATLWITSYWAHPGTLGRFPTPEILWMIASPIALLAMLIGACRAIRQVQFSIRLLRYESWVGIAAAAVMAGSLAGASSWVVSGSPAPRGLFRVGAIDGFGLVVMAAALIIAFRAAQIALGSRPGRPAAR